MTMYRILSATFFVAYSVYCWAPQSGRMQDRAFHLAVASGIGAIAFKPNTAGATKKTPGDSYREAELEQAQLEAYREARSAYRAMRQAHQSITVG